jgi:hypothetical protein
LDNRDCGVKKADGIEEEVVGGKPMRSNFHLLIITCIFSLIQLGQAGVPVAVQQEANAKLGAAEWYERTVAEGVTARSYRFDDLFSARQVIHITEIDMMNPNVGFAFNFRQNEAFLNVSQYADEITSSVAGINGNFFSSAGSVQYLKVDNNLIITTGGADDRGGVSIDASNNLHARVRDDVGGWTALIDPNIMGTNVPIVRNGVQFQFGTGSFYEVDRHPRTLLGTTPNDRALFVVVDGRSTIAAGTTYLESAAIMIALGCDQAVNMDGGGSSTMWDARLNGNGISNIPSDGQQRRVANAIFATSAPSTEPVPAFNAERAGNASNSSSQTPIFLTVGSGETTDVSIDFVNTGTTTWTSSNVRLITSEPFDRTSTLQHTSWISPAIPTALDTPSVPTGAIGTLTFTIQAPDVTEFTTVEESFMLVDDGLTSFGPHQNRLYLTVIPPADGTELVIESRLAASEGGGVTPAPAYQESGPFSNTTSKSNVMMPNVLGAGGRFNFTPGSTATYRPDITIAGTYNVYITMGPGSNNNANASYVISNAGTEVTGSINLRFDDASLVNQWKLLASDVLMEVGSSDGITITNVDGASASGNRFVMDAVRFQLVEAVEEEDPQAGLKAY